MFGPRLFLKRDEEEFLTDQGGMILLPEDWVKLRDEVDSFYSKYSCEQIEAYNQREYDRIWNRNGKRTENKKVQKRKVGYVYFILADNGKFKIGKTTNLKSRFKSVSSSSANKLELIAYIKTEDYSELESEIHNLLLGKRSHGEWFDIDMDDIFLIGEKFEVDIDVA